MMPTFIRLNQKDKAKHLIMMTQLTMRTDHQEFFSQQREENQKQRGKAVCVAASEWEEHMRFGFLRVPGQHLH